MTDYQYGLHGIDWLILLACWVLWMLLIHLAGKKYESNPVAIPLCEQCGDYMPATQQQCATCGDRRTA